MEAKERVRACGEMLAELVQRTERGQFDLPTPCSEWKVVDLLGHVTTGAHLFAASIRGEEFEIGNPTDRVGDDQAASFRAAIDSFGSAIDEADDFDVLISMPFGELPLSMVLEVFGFDVLLHCWDLARATSQNFDPPTEILDSVAAFAHGFVNDGLRDAGAFRPEVSVEDDIPALDRLAAFCGRTP